MKTLMSIMPLILEKIFFQIEFQILGIFTVIEVSNKVNFLFDIKKSNLLFIVMKFL